MKVRRMKARVALAAVLVLPLMSTVGMSAAEAANRAPTITGNPPTVATVGVRYLFAPQASDRDGDTLKFLVKNKPQWMSFNQGTGRLTGVPPSGSEGIYGEIRILVTDGRVRDALPTFAITVSGSGSPDEPPTDEPPSDDPDEPPSDDPDEPPSDEPDEPPSGTLTSIPGIPFNYARSPGSATRSGAMPSRLNAGEVLALADQSMGNDFDLDCNGTQTQPAYIVGGRIRGNNDVFEVHGSWCIFVDTRFDNMQLRTSGDHLVFRNIEIENVSGKNGSSFGGSNIVLVDSEVHHNQGDDRHGIQVSSGANSIWILRNHVHHNGGDGLQACHGCSSNPPRNVYIGGNLFHSDRENAIDFKYIENVIVEGNTIRSLVSAPADQRWCFDDGSGCGTFSSGSDGSGIVVGSDGGPTNVLITDNQIYNTVNAIRIEEGNRIRIEDNNFHDLRSQCLQLDKDGMGTVFSDNTCADSSRGILQNWRDNFSLTVDGNTFENLNGPAVEYESSSVGNASTLTGNVFADSGPVVYGSVVASSAASINALPGAQGNQVQ